MGFYEFAKFDFFSGLHQPLAATEYLLNPEVWDGLSERKKGIIKIAVKVEPRKNFEIAGHNDADAYQEYFEAGAELVMLDDKVIEKAHQLTAERADEHAAETHGSNGFWSNNAGMLQRGKSGRVPHSLFLWVR